MRLKEYSGCVMENSYKPEDHWDKRFRIYRHIGWGDKLIYAYDQPLRLKAIHKALSQTKIPISSSTRVLDVGCGTGDLVLKFAKRGANITRIEEVDFNSNVPFLGKVQL